MPEARPASIGPYRLEKLLGRGGMGEVYRAYDRRLDRRVAIKHVRPDASVQPHCRERLRREAQAAAHLSHPAIVKIFDILESQEGDWIVMELIQGPTLAERLREGPLDVREAVSYGRQLAEGLAEAHAQGLVHRDLKAENVMVMPSGHVKILDFGLVKRLSDAPRDATISVEGAILGTARAMSPEQTRGMTVGPASDLFSLGVLLYEMLTGESAFLGKSFLETVARVNMHHQTPACEKNPQVPRELSDLVDRLLEKSPDLRPADAGEVVAALDRFLSGSQAPGGAFEAPVPRDEEPWDELRDEETRMSGFVPGETGEPPGRRAVPSWKLLRTAPALRKGLAGLLLATLTALMVGGSPSRMDEMAASPPNHAELSVFELYRQGMAYLSRYDRDGNIDRAIATFQEILDRDQESAPAHAGLSRAYWRKYAHANRDRLWLEQALAVAERGVGLDEHLAAARVSLGLALIGLGRFEEASGQLETALVLEPANADAYRGLAEIHEARGEVQETEAAYGKAIEIRPGDRGLHDLLGSFFLRQGRYAEAERAFQRSVELAPDSVFGYRNLATVYHLQNRPAEAAGQLQKALAIRPDLTLYANLGTLLFYQGLYLQAARAYEKSLALEGGANHPLLWGNLGDAYRWVPGREEEASEAYLRAIQLLSEELESKPRDADLKSRRALYLAKRGDRERALGEIAELEELDGKNANVLYRLVVACEVSGERERALTALGEALRAGYSLAEVQRDPELLQLRSDPRYHRLVMPWSSSGDEQAAASVEPS